MKYQTLVKIAFGFAFIFLGIVPAIQTGVIDAPAGRGIRAVEYNQHPAEFSFWMAFYVGASIFLFLSAFIQDKKPRT